MEVASTLNNLALSRILTEDYRAAERYLTDSLALCEENGEQDSLCEAKKYLAEIRLAQGDETSALQLCQEAITLANSLTSTAHEGGALRLLARIQLEQGDVKAARSSIEASLRLLEKINHICEIARAEAVLAEVCLREGDLSQSRAIFDKASASLIRLKAVPDLKSLGLIADKLNQAEQPQIEENK
jgi:tetratricopeptide (TPR) repeat protein